MGGVGDTGRDNELKESQPDRQKTRQKTSRGNKRLKRVEREQPPSLDEPLLTFLVRGVILGNTPIFEAAPHA